ncbi:fluoride efflux transporter FluC [uncultured Prochlorococcus sp.]|uniref:fluoride efflux transporter FluC n=1 Tax=Prochlorococcus sp. TaxID=1220 RepID=UPI000027685A|nr:CrcB family protein [uncultured Prochlorococcus sp.]RCL50764.1 MAG: CrcB family protein [Prochlorococcus sp. MED-G72]
MELDSVIHILAGSTLGLIVRMVIKYISGREKIFTSNTILIVNVLASLFLGIFVSLNITNKNLILFFYVGFLGCLSTFSSFIYQLFQLIQERKYFKLLLYYTEVFVLSFSFFCLGYFITSIWIS